MSLTFVALGLDHRHIYGMTENMIKAGGQCVGFWTDGDPVTLPGYVKRFPEIPRLPSLDAALATGADLALVSCIPGDRTALSLAAMRAGMDVMTDKPGCVTSDELDDIKACVAETHRIWSVNFSERFETPCSTLASALVDQGAIGKVVQTVGLGPHRLNRPTRPDWFFQRARYGGILTDIASHQIDQFLHYTGADTADITLARVANHANPGDPELQDFGELALSAPNGASGYIRVDWDTPDALPNWGDGRLTILGTEGYIELRKYVDFGHEGTDHVILVNGSRSERIDASDAGLPYFDRFAADIRNRTETAMTQSHCFTVMDLAIQAQAKAEAP